MLWPSLGAIAIALAFFQLGALSVWVVVFKVLLLVALGAALYAGLVLAWRRYRGKTPQ